MQTRLLVDAIGANAAAAVAVPGVQLIGAYDTGSADIDWTPAELALIPAGVEVVTIDQANNSTVNTRAHCIIFDVEPGAYQPGQAGQLISQNETPRPTVYVNQSNIVATVQSARTAPNWRGDTWVAIVGWNPGDPWPAAVLEAISLGAVIVAVQNRLDVNGAYDLSDVLDPTWPSEDPVNITIPGINGTWLLPPSFYIDVNGNGFCYGVGMDGQLWLAKRPAGQPWGQPAPL